MTRFKIPRHNIIWAVISDMLDKKMLRDHGILFAGGTLCSMRYGEYRESVDLDFLCADKNSFNSFRANFSDVGKFIYARNPKITKDRVQLWITTTDDRPLKVDFFYEERLQPTASDFHGVEALDHASLMGCKLMAYCDRGMDLSERGKDFIDLIAIDLQAPAETFENAWELAWNAYGTWLTNQLPKIIEKSDASVSAERLIPDGHLRQIFLHHAPCMREKILVASKKQQSQTNKTSL